MQFAFGNLLIALRHCSGFFKVGKMVFKRGGAITQFIKQKTVGFGGDLGGFWIILFPTVSILAISSTTIAQYARLQILIGFSKQEMFLTTCKVTFGNLDLAECI
jgi:hypothetical protein